MTYGTPARKLSSLLLTALAERTRLHERLGFHRHEIWVFRLEQRKHLLRRLAREVRSQHVHIPGRPIAERHDKGRDGWLARHIADIFGFLADPSRNDLLHAFLVNVSQGECL